MSRIRFERLRWIAAVALVVGAACGPAPPRVPPGRASVGSPGTVPAPGTTVTGGASSGATTAPTSAGTTTASAPTPLDERCPGELGGVHATTSAITTSDGVQLYAATIGRGGVGLVMANDVPHSLCEELPEAALFAKHGYRVEVFDYRDRGESGPGGAQPGRLDLDVVAAARALADAGSRCVALAGSYGGAAAAVVAATELHTVALLGFDPAAERGQYIEGPFGPEGALAAAPELGVPVLYVTLQGDRFVPVGEARRLLRATGSSEKSLLVVPNGIIGWSLLDVGASSGRVRRAVFGFLERHATC